MKKVSEYRIWNCFRSVVAVVAISVLGISLFGADKERPNILWIVVDDMSCDFGYQGQALVDTPHVDRLAKEGVVFSNAYVTAAVCSSSRSAMITGMYQTSIGAHNHPSGRGVVKQYLPEPVRMVPELLKEAGYCTSNTNISFKNFGKADYDFVWNPKEIYDAPDWSGRKAGQPFFAQVQLFGGKYRNVPAAYARVKQELEDLITPDQVSLPPYYPDDPVFRKDWAEYLNSVQYTNWEVGRILQRLKDDEVLDNTIIFFMTDHLIDLSHICMPIHLQILSSKICAPGTPEKTGEKKPPQHSFSPLINLAIPVGNGKEPSHR